MNRSYFPLCLSLLSGVVYATPPALEEVLVTGELRQVNQLTLANSVSVISADAIAQRNAKNLEDILNVAPNVNFSTGASRGRFIQIRGIGERSQFESPMNPSVGVIVDGIDFTGLATGVATLDTAQVEIFRGPQGTLYGANALAGMINVTGNGAADVTEGRINVGAGNYGSYDVSAMVNAPLTENVGWRLAAQRNVSDGYIENAYLGRDDTNNIDELNLRNLLRFDISSTFSLSLTSYYIDIDNGYDAFSLDNNRTTLSDEPGHDRQETHAHALKADYTGLSFADFAGLLSYANSQTEYGYDEDWSYRDICSIDSDCAYYQYSTTDNYLRDNDNLTIDLRLLSKPEEQGVRWAMGLYHRDQTVDLLRTYVNNDPDGDPYLPVATPEISTYFSDYQTENTAVYGQLDIPVGDRLTLITGARLERFTADFSDSQNEQFAPEDNLWGGKIAIEYQAANNHFVYALVSRGYKVLGFSPDPDLNAADKTFDTETMRNYELGWKAHWNNTLQLSTAVFYQERSDIQIKQSRSYQIDNTTQFVDLIDNAPGGENHGLETELRWYATDALSIVGTLALLETGYDTYLNCSHVDSDLASDSCYDMSRRPQAHAPKTQYFVAANYRLPASLMFRLEVEGKDSFYFSESHNEQSNAYTLLNARAEYALGAATLALWIKNITDETVETRGFYFSHDYGNDPRNGYAPEPYTQKGAPRTMGASISYEF